MTPKIFEYWKVWLRNLVTSTHQNRRVRMYIVSVCGDGHVCADLFSLKCPQFLPNGSCRKRELLATTMAKQTQYLHESSTEKHCTCHSILSETNIISIPCLEIGFLLPMLVGDIRNRVIERNMLGNHLIDVENAMMQWWKGTNNTHLTSKSTLSSTLSDARYPLAGLVSMARETNWFEPDPLCSSKACFFSAHHICWHDRWILILVW